MSGCARRPRSGLDHAGAGREARRRRAGRGRARRPARRPSPSIRDELAERCRSPRFRRGVLFRDGATVQPARLVKALRRAVLEDDGLDLHERTPGGAPAPRRPEPCCRRPRRRSQARVVVLAVNAAATGWRPLAGRLTNFGSYVVLTEPVPELLEELGLDGRRGDHRRAHVPPLLPHDDGRPRADGQRVRADRARRPARRALHRATQPTAARAEAGLRSPAAGARGRAHRRTPGAGRSTSPPTACRSSARSRTAAVHYAAGFSGNGVGPSWLAAQALASLAHRPRRRVDAPPARRAAAPAGFRRSRSSASAAGSCAPPRSPVEEAEDAGRRPPPGARARRRRFPRLLGIRLGLR